MTPRHDPHALTLARRLQDQVAPAQVVLFGSRARGDWHAASDIDLLVIAEALTPERHQELRHLGGQLERETPRLYPEPVAVQIVALTRTEFNRARRARMHVAGGAQHDGLTATGEPMPPIRQNDPWPAVQEFLRISHRALFYALRHEGAGEHKDAALQSHQALETALKAYVSALGGTFRKHHDLQALIEQVQAAEQVVDFTALDPAWCEAMLKLRRTGPYTDQVDLFRPAAAIVAVVQRTGGAIVARVLALVERRPDEVGYAYSRTDRPLGGLEDVQPAELAPEHLVEQGRIEGRMAERHRALLEAAHQLYESSDQLDALIRHLDQNPPDTWPTLVDLMRGLWPAAVNQDKPPRNSD